MQVSCIKVPNLKGFVYAVIWNFDLGQKFDFKKLSALLISGFFILITILSQMSTFSRNSNHHWNCWEGKRKFFRKS